MLVPPRPGPVPAGLIERALRVFGSSGVAGPKGEEVVAPVPGLRLLRQARRSAFEATVYSPCCA